MPMLIGGGLAGSQGSRFLLGDLAMAFPFLSKKKLKNIKITQIKEPQRSTPLVVRLLGNLLSDHHDVSHQPAGVDGVAQRVAMASYRVKLRRRTSTTRRFWISP
jgi:hypothetical protein